MARPSLRLRLGSTAASTVAQARARVLSQEPLRSRALQWRARSLLRHPEYRDPEALRSSGLMSRWWYYSVELLPGVVTRGQYPDDLPMLPRLMLRRCDLTGADCLDLGSVEGLVPVLMRRGGARSVLATDFSSWCVEKMEAVRLYHSADFDFRSVGLMYDLHRKLRRRSFDLINCSGLLYHVFSPIAVLAGVRPLLRRNGLMIVSTNVLLEEGHFMDFNNAGRLQSESNTFWYPTVSLLDYLLRYLRLRPIEVMHLPHAGLASPIRYRFERPSGYLSVLCRAVDGGAEDEWMERSMAESWEYRELSDWPLADRQPLSSIHHRGDPIEAGTSLWEALRSAPPVPPSVSEGDSHTLRLTAAS